MKKIFASILIFGLAICFTTNFASAQCTTIQDGTLYTSDFRLITPGYDEWGYNYQANMFNGGYCDSYRDVEWCQAYKDVDLIMKWNNAWLSNMDCDNDSLLDRHFGYPTYIGSGAWLTNHQAGKVEVNGKMRKWTYFVKIVAAPSDATVVDGNWVGADSTEIGPVIWGQFAIIQEVINDPSAGQHGIQYKSPSGPGFGQFGPE